MCVGGWVEFGLRVLDDVDPRSSPSRRQRGDGDRQHVRESTAGFQQFHVAVPDRRSGDQFGIPSLRRDVDAYTEGGAVPVADRLAQSSISGQHQRGVATIGSDAGGRGLRRQERRGGEAPWASQVANSCCPIPEVFDVRTNPWRQRVWIPRQQPSPVE